MGFESWSYNIHTEKKYVNEFFDFCKYYIEELGKTLADEGAESIIIGDDSAWKGGPLIPPTLYKEWILPRYKEINTAFHKKGLKVILHSDGNIWSLLPSIVEAGFDAIHPCEETADMTLQKLKARYGTKLCLSGNILLQTLSQGTPEDVEEEVKNKIEIAAPGGGYILSDGNSITDDVPYQNFIALLQANKKYGKYPC